jgi:ubiquinone/menaquinone biosynthesis C-methylase UbiE
MKKLRNWDNKTWLSSKKYVNAFNKFLKSKIKFNKNTKILDIGCGRANIISSLQRKYKFLNKPIGIDILKNKHIKKNVLFKKCDAIKYLKKNENFDLILIKQTMHFFSKKKLDLLLNLAKKRLNSKGKILIFSLKLKKNEIPCFKLMKQKLNVSLKKDQVLLKLIKRNLKTLNESSFNFKTSISKKIYLSMINARYISCLLNLSKKDINKGVKEVKSKFKNRIIFTDRLVCLDFKKI